MDPLSDNTLSDILKLWTSNLHLDGPVSNNPDKLCSVIGSKPADTDSFLFKDCFTTTTTPTDSVVALNSTGNSDKSISSFGSESNDSTEVPGSVNTDTLHNGYNSNELKQTVRDSASQSPAAMFGFSSSNSSSPLLSQTSGPSSASSLSEAVCTNAGLKFNNNIVGSNVPANPSFPQPPVSSMPFNLAKSGKDPSSLEMLSSVLSHNRNGNDFGDSLSTLLDSGSFLTSDSSNFDQRRQQGLLTTLTQDSLPPYFQNSFNSMPDKDVLSLSNSGKLSLFNGNINNSNPTSVAAAITSPITPLFSSTNFLFNDSIERQTSGGFASSNIQSPNVQMQARFDSHIQSLSAEIDSTAQLYVHSIQMRKEQLLKQLERIKSTYSVLIADDLKGKIQIPLARMTFNRPDQTFFKSITTFGFLNTPAYGLYCNASGEGLTIAIEGEPTCFLVATRNCFNEEICTGCESVEVDIQPFESISGSFLSYKCHIQKNIVDNNNGRYNVTYVIPRNSDLRRVKITVKVNGLNINNSPFYATVKTERLRESWRRIVMFGEEGSEPGKFCRPWGIAIARLPLQQDSSHSLVGDSSQTSSRNIPSNSKPFYTWNNTNINQVDYLLVVADRSNNRVQLIKLTVPDPNLNKSNCLVVNNKVDLSVVHVFGSGPGSRPGQFDRPAGIAINSNLGQLIVADKDNHRIQVFDLAGNFQFKFGEKGSRPGQFCYPWDIAVCKQTSLILVSDTRNRRIQLFNHFGKYVWHCSQPLDSPRGVAFLSPDRYLISDFNKHRLLIIDKNESCTNTHGPIYDLMNSKYIGFGEGGAWGEFLRPQGLAASLTKNSNGAAIYMQIFCADSRNNRIAIYNSLNRNFEYINETITNGDNISNTTTSYSFDRPSGIAIADNILAVVDFGNNRLQIFQKCLV